MASLRVQQLQDEEDKLSDIVQTGSTDISRQPSLQPSAGPSIQPSAAPSVAAEEVDELAEDGDAPMDVDEKVEDGAALAVEPVTPQTKKAEKAAARELKRQNKDEQEENLAKGRTGLKHRKLADSIKRFEYLLGQTDLFQHFCDLKAKRDPEFARMLAETKSSMEAKKGKRRGRKPKNEDDGNHRRRKTEKEEDAELLADADDQPFAFDESPNYVKGGEMRDYQVQGLNWMISLYHNGINGILADEMGLGKTLQTISFLGYLKTFLDTPGPHLVVVPKSTLDNWAREFDHWVPGFRTIILRGTPDERTDIINSTILKQKFDVCITSYEICQREKNSLKKLAWEYIVIDEAHRIKNVNSILSQIVRIFESRGRLLITGTPLQNNLEELWALLNFLLHFNSWFDKQSAAPAATDATEETGAEVEPAKIESEPVAELKTEEPADEPMVDDETGEPIEPVASTSAVPAMDPEKNNAVVKQLHKVLRPFLLRRVKADVEHSLLPKKEINIYVGMTDMQRKWYRMLLERDLDAVNGASGRKEGKTRLLNIVMQLRKCCNHPYLFDGAEPGPPFTTDEHLVFNSGKMLILDKLLKAMQAKGSRVLIFSQMSRMLDILEDYCLFRGYGYCRIDGSTAHEDRIAAIDEYNKEGSEKFVFLLTTRAGGLGINLTSADVVVLYDSDWNPQADLQAMDRAHRIGQKKQVFVFRFVTENAVEEKVLERAASKLQLDRLVIQEGRQKSSSKNADKGELIAMVQHGADKIVDANTSMLVDDDIDAVIARGEEKTSSLHTKWQGMGIDELSNFKVESATTAWEGEAFGRKKLGAGWLEPSGRQRKGGNYSVDGYYRDAMGERRGTGPRGPRSLKPPNLDFQFAPKEFYEILEKERRWKEKESEVIVMIPEGKEAEGKTPEKLEAERAAEQEIIDNAEPLTEAEEAKKTELHMKGFHDWSRRDLQAFLRGAEASGRQNWAGIQKELGESKTVDQVKEYGKVFWKRYAEIEDGEKMVAKIENAESKKDTNRRQNQLIKKHVGDCAYPYQQLSIPYGGQTKGKQYTEEEDRFLLVQLSRAEYGNDEVYESIKRAICEWPAFRFDWFIKSRTPAEIGRRCTTLVGLLVKDSGEEDLKPPTNTGKGPRKSAAANENGSTSTGTKSRKRKGANADDGGSVGDTASRASTPVAGPSKPKKRAR